LIHDFSISHPKAEKCAFILFMYFKKGHTILNLRENLDHLIICLYVLQLFHRRNEKLKISI